MSADPYDAVQDARSDRSEWTDGDVADDEAEAFRWGFTPDGRDLAHDRSLWADWRVLRVSQKRRAPVSMRGHAYRGTDG